MKQLRTRVRKRVSKVALVALVAALQWLSRALPFRLSVAFGGRLGSIFYYLLHRDRKRALDNLAAVFPDKSSAWARNTVHKMFRHLGKSLLEILTLTPQRIKSLVEWQGLDNLHAALVRNKGLVFVTGHLGNWEIMAGAVAAHCHLSVIAAPIDPEALNEMIVRLRAGLGVRTIVRSRSGAAKELIRVFRENRVLGILIDQDTDVDGVFVDFMGRPAWTPSAAAQMAIKFGAPIVFGYVQRLPDDRHRITIEGPLELIKTGQSDEDVRLNTAAFTKRIEAVVKNCPEQWVWMHRRWRRQP